MFKINNNQKIIPRKQRLNTEVEEELYYTNKKIVKQKIRIILKSYKHINVIHQKK